MKKQSIQIAGLLALAGLGLAQAQSNDSLQKRIEELDQKIRVVERLNEIAQEDAKAAAAKAPKINASAGNLGFSSADGAFSLRYSGFIQSSGLYFLTDDVAKDNATNIGRSFSVRRLQSDVRGTAYKDFGWRVHLNFAGNAVAVQDVQFDWNLKPEFNLSAGKFKPPTGLERLLSSPRAPFVEGSFVTLLQPNRDLGVQASGNLGKGLLQYQAGVFNGANDNADASGPVSNSDADKGKDVYVRLFAHPFVNGSEALKGLGVGVSGSYGKRENGNSVAVTGLQNITTVGRQNITPYTVAADTLDGALYRVSPQAYYYTGPFGVIAEYTQTTQAVRNGANNADLTNSAWALTGSWILTGEKNDYRSGPKVAKPNNWPKGGDLGALELLGRVHGISIDDKVPGTYGPAAGVESALGTGVALGWYLNNVFKIFASYEHTTFANAAGTDRKAEDALSLSFNVAY